MSVAAAAETHGGAAEHGQRHGRLLPEQRPEPAQLGLLRVHRHDPGGRGSFYEVFLASKQWSHDTVTFLPVPSSQIQQAAERPERNFVDTRQLKVNTHTCPTELPLQPLPVTHSVHVM